MVWGTYPFSWEPWQNVCVPPNSNAEALTPSGSVFGDGTSKEVAFNEVVRLGPWSDRISIWQCPYKKTQKTLFLSLSLCLSFPLFLLLVHMHRGKALWAYREKGTDCLHPKGRACTSTNSAENLTRDFYLLQLREINFLLLKPPRLWCFVIVAWADKYNKQLSCQGQWSPDVLASHTWIIIKPIF